MTVQVRTGGPGQRLASLDEPGVSVYKATPTPPVASTTPPPQKLQGGVPPVPQINTQTPTVKTTTPTPPKQVTSTAVPSFGLPASTNNLTGQAPSTPGSLGLDFMRQVTPNELVANQLNNLLSSDSAYIKNARLRGKEYANSRGMLNSSIAAGASERAALEAAMPIAQSDADVYRTANQGNFESLNQLREMRTAAELDNWLSSESFNRDFNAELAMIPVRSGADMLAYITQRAMEDPAVWSPDVISGFNNFFNLNMKDMFSNFFSGPGGG